MLVGVLDKPTTMDTMPLEDSPPPDVLVNANSSARTRLAYDMVALDDRSGVPDSPPGGYTIMNLMLFDGTETCGN